MAEIVNAQLKSLCNDRLRVVADQLAHVDSVLAAIIAEYNAKGLGTIINDAGSANLIADDSETDGRTRRSGGDVFNFVTLLQDFQIFMTPGRRDVLLGWQVNGVKA